MLDPQRIVEEIQAALLSSNILDWDLLRDAAAEYSAACDEANERLTECGRLLKRGLRSEALQLAEQEPNLLDAVALLDFPELPEWRQLLAVNGMVVPTALRIDIASDLNVAYATEAPLLALLKRHRLLALGRAPLSARIQVLRAIRLGDVANPIWTDDLRLLEIARHQELQRRIEAAAKVRDLGEMKVLLAEVLDPAWVNPPNGPLRELSQQKHNAVASSRAVEQLETLEQQLSAAYAVFDVCEGRVVRNGWHGAAAIAALPADHALLHRAAPALAWLDEQDRREERAAAFASALGNLDHALENQQPAQQLERCFQAVQRFEEEIPVRVTRQYQERMRSFETAARRRFVVSAIAVLGLLVVVGAATGWIIHRSQQREALIAATQGLSKLVDAKNAIEAQKFYDDLNLRLPAVALHSDVQHQVARLSALVQQEEQRRATFDRLLQQVTTAGLEAPDRVALVEAESLAATAEEKTSVVRWKADFNRQDIQRQRDRDTAFQEGFRKLLADTETCDEQLDAGAAVAAGHVEQLVAEVDALQRRSGAVTQQLVVQLAPLRTRLTVLGRRIASDRAQNDALVQLSRDVGNPKAYQRSLQLFITNHPNSLLKPQFERAVVDAPLWEGTHQWRALLSDERFGKLGQLSPADAKKLLASGKSLLETAGNVPLAEVFRERSEFLSSVAGRLDESDKSRLEALESLFDNALIGGLYLVETNTGERHYVSAQPDLTARPLVLESITGFDLTTRKVQIGVNKTIVHSDVSPQAQLATLARPMLRMASDGQWERGMFALTKLVAEQKRLDPVLRFILMRRVVEIGRGGSHSMHVALAPLSDRIEAADVDLTANWLVWNDPAAEKARVQAKAILDSVGDLNELAQLTARALVRETSPLPPTPRWVGWLRPASEHGWCCEPAQLGDVTGDILIISNSSNTTGAEAVAWRKIGNCTGGKIDWLETDEQWVAGRPLYLAVTTSSARPGGIKATSTTSR